ncbi:MAG TPA: hypothetical protein VEP90_26410 [Methylomirabilota bacterium]|nr:hypothetical protein [Methylomirabilota bacterium]
MKKAITVCIILVILFRTFRTRRSEDKRENTANHKKHNRNRKYCIKCHFYYFLSSLKKSFLLDKIKLTVQKNNTPIAPNSNTQIFLVSTPCTSGEITNTTKTPCPALSKIFDNLSIWFGVNTGFLGKKNSIDRYCIAEK